MYDAHIQSHCPNLDDASPEVTAATIPNVTRLVGLGILGYALWLGRLPVIAGAARILSARVASTTGAGAASAAYARAIAAAAPTA